MAEAGDVSDATQLGQGPGAADMGNGALAPTAGAEEGGRRPEPQRQFWRGRRATVRSAAVREMPAKANGAPCSQHSLWRHPEPWPQRWSYLQSWVGGWLQTLLPSSGERAGRPTCPLVACGQQHSASGCLATAILDLDGECGLHTGPWLGNADRHGKRGTGLL